jgi:threonine synthase
MAQKFIGYQCSLCGKTYSPGEITYTCPVDGGNLDVILDYDLINKEGKLKEITSSHDTSLWRYLPLLPVGDPGFVGTSLRIAGGTPILTPIKLGEELGIKKLWIKDEGRNPSASFKDRASAIVVARTRELKSEIVVTASTGNAGAALACMAAAVGQTAIIFAPKTAPQAKVAQLLIFGAKVILVDGNYDSAFDLTIEASKEFGWYCRNTGYNPFTLEGKKTAAFEIWETLLNNRKPNKQLTIFVSVGDGNIISGLHKGFKDLQKLGWLEQMPRIIGVQAEGSAAIYNAFHSGTEEIIPVNAVTIADSISSDLPRDGVRAVRAAKQTGGTYIKVTDDEIVKAIAKLGNVGLFAEPAGSTAYAGLEKAVRENIVSHDDDILVMNTGSGLKDIRTAMQAVTAAPIIEPTLKELVKYLNQ